MATASARARSGCRTSCRERTVPYEYAGIYVPVSLRRNGSLQGPSPCAYCACALCITNSSCFRLLNLPSPSPHVSKIACPHPVSAPTYCPSRPCCSLPSVLQHVTRHQHAAPIQQVRVYVWHVHLLHHCYWHCAVGVMPVLPCTCRYTPVLSTCFTRTHVVHCSCAPTQPANPMRPWSLHF